LPKAFIFGTALLTLYIMLIIATLPFTINAYLLMAIDAIPLCGGGVFVR
jgi:hypothetical protein